MGSSGIMTGLGNRRKGKEVVVRFVSLRIAGTESYGVLLDGDAVLDLPAAAKLAGEELPHAMVPFIAAGAPALAAARRLAAAASDVKLAAAIRPRGTYRLLAPIPRPLKNVFCVGRNYRDHVAEGARAAGMDPNYPKYPQFFTKPPTAVIGPGEAFHHDPGVTQRLDYEVELAVVIGEGGRDIGAADALAHVFGLTILNDITARDLQRRHDQWFKGKGLDGSCPMGPAIVELADIADLPGLELSLTVDGEPRQRAHVRDMIFGIPEIIASLSRGMTLESGDIIATGTPAGVGFAMDPPRYLSAGNVVRCRISGLGELVTPIEGLGAKTAADGS
jgi:2-keto-4-pentenoate hydratase/2-oxohepta-3-ene-1,7-dioic acid hydratase in catechol pathway